MSSLKEDFENFRKSDFSNSRDLQYEKLMMSKIGESFEDRALKLFEIKDCLNIQNYVVFLYQLVRLNTTDSEFENFLKLSQFHKNQIIKRSSEESIAGLVLALNLVDSERIEILEYLYSNINPLMCSLEESNSFESNPHYESVSDHREVLIIFKNIVDKFSDLKTEKGGKVYGVGFKTLSYILRNLFGEYIVLEVLKRFEQENFECNAENFVKIVAFYDSFKDHPLDWIEQLVSGTTLDDLRKTLHF